MKDRGKPRISTGHDQSVSSRKAPLSQCNPGRTWTGASATVAGWQPGRKLILSSRKSAPTLELNLIRGATKGWELAARLDTQLPNPTRVLLEQHAEELLHVVAHDTHLQRIDNR